ncbi:MAG TPA: LysR family transcriptional regulator [Rhodocyclaceae bacterium]|nr:LysR family transcriptional regulator [Rhodocyclaceae bacterium]
MKEFDLNLLRVLVAVYDARSVSRAAQALGVSQPTVSTALGKLRRSFGEPLFVKTTAGVSPTARTHALAASAREVLSQIEAEMLCEATFEPATTSGTFTFALSDVGEMVFLPKILASVRRQAPRAGVRSVALSPPQIEEGMERGDIDLAVGYFPDLDSAAFRQQHLFTHRFVCLLRADHPLRGDRLTLEQFLELGHAVIRAEGRSQEIFETYLERHRIERRIVLRTPHFMSIPTVIGQSDLIVTLPHAIGHYFSRIGANVRMVEPPLALPPIPLFQHWHRSYHHDPRNRWLRTLVAMLFNVRNDEWPYPFADRSGDPPCPAIGRGVSPTA